MFSLPRYENQTRSYKTLHDYLIIFTYTHMCVTSHSHIHNVVIEYALIGSVKQLE